MGSQVLLIRISFPLCKIKVVVVFELGIQDTFRDEAFIPMRVDFDPRRWVLWLVVMTLLVFLK
jgi:hypothetical protein